LVILSYLVWAGRAPVSAESSTDESIEVSQVDHPDSAVDWGRAATVIAAPKRQVLRAVEDYAGYQRFIPHFRLSKVLSQRGRAALVYFEANIAMFTFWSEMRCAPEPPAHGTEVIEGKMVRGNAQLMEARWEVKPVDADHTWVALQLILVPKVPLPTSFVSSENASASMKAVRALRRMLEQGH
jgi:ribosome-associated toxin RatA of RatAB toxin-antitoxin module